MVLIFRIFFWKKNAVWYNGRLNRINFFDFFNMILNFYSNWFHEMSPIRFRYCIVEVFFQVFFRVSYFLKNFSYFPKASLYRVQWSISKQLTLHLNSVYDAPIQFLDAKRPPPITSLSKVECDWKLTLLLSRISSFQW